MGKICYRPQEDKEKQLVEQVESISETGEIEDKQKIQEALVEQDTTDNVEEYEDSMFTGYEEVTENQADLSVNEPRTIPNKTRHEKKKLDNVKMMGDMGCDYHIYMEDYVYTYIYQYAFSDISKENSAILIGEVYLDSKEAVITGMIPIDNTRLTDDSEWINLEVVNEIEEVRKQYFKDQDIIGWLHMQPGYGTMLTMKELREHRNVFEGAGSVFMLVDALNKIETVYVYEDEELKEQSGYCMYYEPNEPMQQYMVEHPFARKETEEIKDTVVNQFREIGKLRKEEYLQKKNMGFTVMAAAIILVAIAGIIVRMNDTQGGMNSTSVMSEEVATSPSDMNGIVVTANDEIGMVTNSSNIADVEDITKKEVLNNIDNKEDEKKDQKEVVKDDIESDIESDIENDIEIVDISNDESVETVSQEHATKPVVEEVQEEVQEEIVTDTAEYDVYIVKQGDTLANISYDRYGDAKKSLEIAKINKLDSTNNIYVGQELKVPKK